MAIRYNNIPLKLSQGTLTKIPTAVYQTTKYPEIPLSVNDTYVITTLGDRLDLLAQQFYGDVNLYWVIACANPDKVGFSSLFINEGSEIRIPANVSQIKALYNSLNVL